MTNSSESIQKLSGYFIKLPGVGRRTANRYIESLLNLPSADLKELGTIIQNLKTVLKKCPTCNLTHIKEKCPICDDKNRDHTKILIVKSSADVKNFEQTKQWDGLYHVLGTLLNPIRNIGPDKLNLNKLIQRIKSPSVLASPPNPKSQIPIPKEVIIGLNFDPAGDMTALHIKKILKPYKVKVSRLARGLPSGADLEYMDEETLTSALKNRD